MDELVRLRGEIGAGELALRGQLGLAPEAEVRLIACQMTMDLFEFSKDDMIDGIDIGGAATYIECATQADINLFI